MRVLRKTHDTKIKFIFSNRVYAREAKFFNVIYVLAKQRRANTTNNYHNRTVYT